MSRLQVSARQGDPRVGKGILPLSVDGCGHRSLETPGTATESPRGALRLCIHLLGERRGVWDRCLDLGHRPGPGGGAMVVGVRWEEGRAKVTRGLPSTQRVLAGPAEGAAAAAVGRELRGLGGHRAGPGPPPAAHPSRAAVCAPPAEPWGQHRGGRWAAAQEPWFEKDWARLGGHGPVLGGSKGHIFALECLRYLALPRRSRQTPREQTWNHIGV